MPSNKSMQPRRSSQQLGGDVTQTQASPRYRCISDYQPSLGGYCAGCRRTLPCVAGIVDADELRARALIDSGRTVDAIRFFHDRFDLSLFDSKLIVMHMYGGWQRPLGPPCVSCGTPLRTPRAKICVECGTRCDERP